MLDWACCRSCWLLTTLHLKAQVKKKELHKISENFRRDGSYIYIIYYLSIHYCLLCHQHFHHIEMPSLFVRSGEVAGSDKDFAELFTRLSEDVSLPHCHHLHRSPKQYRKPKPNTTACEQGTGRSSAILSPAFKQTPRGVCT